ncbi:MAG TPA: Nif3-like dinuclear metal center hexameric protein [Bryobacteraceae bacterium]|nr:Nif3-like dinuclear metal center hexameric protein [Bryobacteraceae bacterium]
MTRRTALFAVAASAAAQPKTLTAGEVVERIRRAVGVPWRAETVDTLKTGNTDTPVTGIATTFMSTLDVMQRAVASGKNMIITHEPTFYAHDDGTKDTAGDSTLLAKQAFIEKNRVVVFRFHDHWHMRRPDGIRTGMLAELGWQQYEKPGERVLEMPPTTLEALAKSIKDRLRIRAIRVMGNPKQTIARVALNPGYANLAGAVRALQNADVLVIGEAREWEAYEYVQDMLAAGSRKSLIVLGHAVSEEGGMKECARWLKPLVPEVDVAHVPAGEPFWSL